MINFYIRYSKPITIYLLLALTIAFNIFLFPRFFPANALDTKLYYSNSEAYEILDGFIEEGRNKYRLGLLTIDFIYPVLYSFLLSSTLFKIYRRVNIATFPFGIMAMDYFENTGILLLLYNYPEKMILTANITGTFTSLKWLFLGICLILIIAGLIINFTNWRRKIIN
jgi:hypothetical protein